MNVDVWRALDWTLYGAVHGAVGDEVWRSVNVDVDVNLGVGRVVLEVVRGAVWGATGSHLEHHALQDFLCVTRVGAEEEG